MGRPYESRRARGNMVGHTPDQGLAMSAQLQAVEGATEIAAVMRELGSRVAIDNAWAQGNPEILNALATQRVLTSKPKPPR